ncbi:MAG TPA: hypothetical protein VLH58_06260 [Candidatus Methylomirabilis sp.]|nr:hypothetical protein [Candidatus Methylomirabilis sp.]HSC70938.1 hypothetical protein [Candidatus Methylomirabilis sp.]
MGWRPPMPCLVLSALLAASPAAAQTLNPLQRIHSLLSGFDRDPKTATIGSSEFQRPVWMAVISAGRGARFLLGAGDPIFREAEPQAIGVVREVTPVSLGLSLGREGREVRTFPGRSIPGTQELILEDTHLVKALEYRQRVVAADHPKVQGGELYLVGLEGTRAILQRDVDPPPSRAELLRQRLEALPIVQIRPGTFEVKRSDVRAAMESGEEIVDQAIRDSRLDVSPGKGVGLEVKSPIADVRIDNRGFTITNPNLAAKTGLLVGDRIMDVNGLPVDSLEGLVQTYRYLRSLPDVRTIRVTVKRSSLPLTFRFLIR